MSELYLTTRDVAKHVGMKTTQGVWLLIEKGKLPCARKRMIGPCRFRYYIAPEEVAAYLSVYDPKLLPAFDAWLAEKEKDSQRAQRSVA